MIRTYSKLARLRTFEERFDYLSLKGAVGERTFGSERFLNQRFYTSSQWKQVRDHVIARDLGCDLGISGYEVHYKPIIHHMNPMTPSDIIHGDEKILDPEFLITTSHRTHNAIHFGDESLLIKPFAERTPGDTKLW